MWLIRLGENNGKIERSRKLLGKVQEAQMFKPNTKIWLLKRINPKCENCNDNDHYTVDKSFIKPLGLFFLGETDVVIRIICPNCGETIELDREEFSLIRPFLKINSLLESGKIDEY